MKIAVWDTYVKISSGEVLHFDILVPDTVSDTAIVYEYGREYLQSIGANNSLLAVEECQFCHIEQPSNEVIKDVNLKGYHILVMDIIPATLSAQPNRREKIMFIKAHEAAWRFKSFSGITDEKLDEILNSVK